MIRAGDVQAIIARINASLLRRGYLVWFDLDKMKGSTLDAMSEAVEGAEVMLYGVSKKCTLHVLVSCAVYNADAMVLGVARR